MGRIVGLLVLGLTLVMVGFNIAALSWLGIVGLVLFVATGFFGAVNATVHTMEQRVGDGAMSSQPGRDRLGRRQPAGVGGLVTRRPGVGGRVRNHRGSGTQR